MNQFGSHLCRYRKSKGWTQTELAYRAGISPGYVSQIEAGMKTLKNINKLVKLSKALGCEVQLLLQWMGVIEDVKEKRLLDGRCQDASN